MKPTSTSFPPKQFIIITLIVSIWINLSEVFRYFVLVMPRTKAFFNDRSGLAQMDWGIFTIWGIWDTLLTALLVYVFWLHQRWLGNNLKAVLASANLAWLAVFVIFWVASANMGLASWNILWITLPLSWIEMFVGAWLASNLYRIMVLKRFENA